MTVMIAQTPQISDFGLAKLMPNGEDIYATTKLLGTFGYFDPEYASVCIHFLLIS